MQIVKLRTRKNYAEASNHVLVGAVIFETDTYITLHCRSFHYKAITLDSDQVVEGTTETRIVPWSNVECMSILEDDFPWETAALDRCEEGICLKEGDQATLVTRYKVSHQ